MWILQYFNKLKKEMNESNGNYNEMLIIMIIVIMVFGVKMNKSFGSNTMT